MVDGPDAALFLNLMYYNELANLKPGRLRYVLLLRETGVVYDDGVVARLSPTRYLLSPSSSHTSGVLALLEAWRQTEYPHLRVAFHDTTAAWATFAVSGPRSREVIAPLTDIDLSPDALPHMDFAEGQILGAACRIARVSFTPPATAPRSGGRCGRLARRTASARTASNRSRCCAPKKVTS